MAFLKQSSVLFLLGCATAVYSQQARTLTDQEVQAAIERGYAKPHSIGLSMQEGGGSCNTCPTSGYGVHLYNPAQWIELQAMQAKYKMVPFAIADVTLEMRQPLLHVEAWPDTPNFLTGDAMGAASSVHRVVLADLAKQILIQPLSNVTEDLKSESALRSATYTKAIATFNMDDLQKVRGSSNGEFYVVVVGDRNKDFKVKSKMFGKLF